MITRRHIRGGLNDTTLSMQMKFNRFFEIDYAYWEMRLAAVTIIPALVRMVGGETPDIKISDVLDIRAQRKQAKIHSYSVRLAGTGLGPRGGGVR